MTVRLTAKTTARLMHVSAMWINDSGTTGRSQAQVLVVSHAGKQDHDAYR